MFESFGVTEADVALVAGGLMSGVALGVLVARAAFVRGATARLARRFDVLEFRLLSQNDYGAVLRAGAAASGEAPLLAGQGLSRLLGDGGGRRWLPRSRPTTEQLSAELADSIRTNLESAIDMGNAIAENKELGDPAVRREVTRTVKRAGEKLTTAFWEKHGTLVKESGIPQSLKAKLEQFYAQVGRLKRAVAELAAEPAISSLIQVVERVVELLNTAREIAEEVQRLSAA